MSERDRRYYVAHREKILASRKACRIVRGEEVLVRDRAYYASHREQKKACRVAHREYQRAYGKVYYATHREKLLAQQKIRRVAYRKRALALQRFHKYGLTQEAFEVLLYKQGGVCAICKKPDWGLRGPHVDHDHVTGRVRGILCKSCNVALGMVKDNLGIARALVVYLEVSDDSS